MLASSAMTRPRKKRPATTADQIKQLRRRVTLLERALRRASEKPQCLGAAARRHDDAAKEARRKALSDYYKQQEIEHYLRNPNFLRIAIESENEKNAFLKSRGLEPEPSSIPEQFRRGLKGYLPQTRR